LEDVAKLINSTKYEWILLSNLLHLVHALSFATSPFYDNFAEKVTNFVIAKIYWIISSIIFDMQYHGFVHSKKIISKQPDPNIKSEVNI
jgi:hypothetical protein